MLLEKKRETWRYFTTRTINLHHNQAKGVRFSWPNSDPAFRGSVQAPSLLSNNRLFSVVHLEVFRGPGSNFWTREASTNISDLWPTPAENVLEAHVVRGHG